MIACVFRRRRLARLSVTCGISVVLSTGIITAVPATADSNDLFIPLTGARVAFGDKNEPAKVDEHDTARLLGFTRVNPSALTKDTVRLNLGSGSTVVAKRVRVERHSDRSLTWIGAIEQSGNPVTLVIRNGQITGSIFEGNRIISVRSADVAGVHAISQLDARALPKEEPPSFAKTAARSNTAVAARVSGTGADVQHVTSTPTITVLVAYTAATKRARPDVTGLVRLAEAETNESYRRSGVKINLKVVKIMPATVVENGSFDDDLKHFVADPQVKQARKAAKASIAVLLIADQQFCGLADAIMATPQTAFAVVYYDCATGYYSFGHEIGHLQGARHDEKHDPGDPGQPNHGFLHPSPQAALAWRTIMGYACDAPDACPRRVQNWSNPNVKLNGLPTGTSRLNNNAAILNQTAATIASFGAKL